jgi:hypothetical protein
VALFFALIARDCAGIQVIINCSALPCLLNLLNNNHRKSIKKEACWTISNITAGNKDQIQSIIDSNIIPPLIHLLGHAEFDIKKEAAWAISNATSGGTHAQIKCVEPTTETLPLTNSVKAQRQGIHDISMGGRICTGHAMNTEVNSWDTSFSHLYALKPCGQVVFCIYLDNSL